MSRSPRRSTRAFEPPARDELRAWRDGIRNPALVDATSPTVTTLTSRTGDLDVLLGLTDTDSSVPHRIRGDWYYGLTQRTVNLAAVEDPMWRSSMVAEEGRSLTVRVWIGDYWLASSADLARLVPEEPEARHDDCGEIRWKCVADRAREVLTAARTKVGEVRSPQLAAAWDVDVTVDWPGGLTAEEVRCPHRCVAFFDGEGAAADHSSDQVTNGRPRMFQAARAGAEYVPVQSAGVSAWSDNLFGDRENTRLEWQTSSCAYLFRFAGTCVAWRDQAGADVDFIESLAEALVVAEDFLDRVAADAAKVDPLPRRTVLR